MNPYHGISLSKRRMIVLTVMLVAILEVLDSTIINVALPYMMPSLGADQEQITWVLTSYVVASAMILPLTGFLSDRLGHRRLLLIAIFGFMVSSILCGLASTLTTMVFFRLLQGAFGAALIPLSQAILREAFAKNEQGKAMAIWGMGIMTAPALGPTLGGWITQHASWRWIFYINLPTCLIGILLTLSVIPKTTGKARKIDVLGMLLMFAGIGSLQIFLDQGNTQDWFDSTAILLLLITCILTLSYFIIRTLKHKTPLIQLNIFKDRNFTISTVALAIFAGSVFGLLTLEPIMLENLFGYTALNAGLILSPMGICSALAMVIIAPMINKVPIKMILTLALGCCLMGAYQCSLLTLDAANYNFMICNAWLGFGMGFFMVPISTYALMTVPTCYITEGSGLFSYGRMLGTSVGISLLSTVSSRFMQKDWNQLGEQINRYNPQLHTWLQETHQVLQPTTYHTLQTTLAAQADMLAFTNTYRLIAFALLLLIPWILCMKPVHIERLSLEH